MTSNSPNRAHSSAVPRVVPLNLVREIRYSNNSRRSPIQLSQTRISPYTIPRYSINSRTPEPLPETSDVNEEQMRRLE